MKGYWAPPHGRCDYRDSSEKECVKREVFEETKLKIKPLKKLWTTKADTKVKTVSFWLTEALAGKIEINKRESSRYKWFNLREVLKLKLYPGTKLFFKHLKDGKIKL